MCGMSVLGVPGDVHVPICEVLVYSVMNLATELTCLTVSAT